MALLGLADPAPAVVIELCDAWPGEPTPLPTVGDAAPLRARWAALRATELTQLAKELERSRPGEAHRLWRHAVCLDPSRDGARAGADRTRPVRVHRPRPVPVREASAPLRPLQLSTVLRVLSEPFPVYVPRPSTAAVVSPRPESPRPETATQIEPERRPVVPPLADAAEVLRLVDGAEEALHAARYEDSLEASRAARRALGALPDDAEARGLRVRLEILAATAAIAIGDEGHARSSFRRALRADPDLDLSPLEHSPKVFRAFEAARAEVWRRP